ncbi:MAG: helix-turn-helix transcriptional regulator [Alphaproteobacteria bacterium]|nr:helix-turn-helix transcriptional regulator [Alphaproteobacteria bacterium]
MDLGMALQPNPVDIHVGRRLRLRRTLLGYSQEKLGSLLGLTFQQVQKYERGTNRIGSSRLYKISSVLDVPVSYFFEGFEEAEGGVAKAALPSGLAEEPAPFEASPMDRRETLELVRAYYRIEDPLVRRRVFELIKSLGPARVAGEPQGVSGAASEESPPTPSDA